MLSPGPKGRSAGSACGQRSTDSVARPSSPCLATHFGPSVFLVLSGFLITALLLTELGRTGGIRYPRFLGRRATRLLPALFVLLAARAYWGTQRQSNRGVT